MKAPCLLTVTDAMISTKFWITFSAREDQGKRENPPYRPYTQALHENTNATLE